MSGDLNDIEWLTEQAATRSASSIARELGVASDTVLRAMRLQGIPVHFGTSQRQPDPIAVLEDADWLAEQYESKSAETIGRELDVHPGRVRKALERHGIPIRGPGDRQKFRTPAELDDVDWLRQRYESEGRSGAQIAEELDVSFAAVHKAMRRLGLEAEGAWVRRDTTRLKRPSRSQLEQAWRSEQSIKGISRRFGVAHTTAAVWLADVGIFVHDTPAISRSDLLAAIDAGKSIRAIATDHGMTDRTVMIELRRHGLRDAHRLRPKQFAE